MNFAEISSGESIFIDANVFIYYFGPDPDFGPPSQVLLERVETGDIRAVVSADVLSEIAHRLMALEACATFGWPYAGIARRLRRHYADIPKLHRYREALDEIVGMGVQVLPVLPAQVLAAADLSRSVGLLSGDALVVAVMQSHGLSILASNDADFDRVSGITRYSPI